MNEHEQNENLEMPAELAKALRGLQKERVFVPQEVDTKILGHARKHLAKKAVRLVLPPKWVAMAAAFTLVCAISYVVLLQQKPTPAFAAEDFNRDGEVNILDAYALARKVNSGEKVQVDLTHDGSTDRHDIEAIAIEAVKLGKGGAS